MFARTAFRAAQPLKSRVRHYASDAAPRTATNTALYAGVAALAGVGGYYYVYRTPTAQKAVDSVQKAPTPRPREEEKTVPGRAGEEPSSPSAGVFRGGDQGWVDLKLEKVETINHNTKRFRFALPDSRDVSGLRVASALLVKFKGRDMDKPVIRPYTPVSDESAEGYLDFVIKRYPNGPMSEHLHGMSPDQRLDFKGPIPKYPWAPNKHEHIALIAGGTGITPMYQLCRAIFNNPEDRTKVTLVFGNVTEDDVLLKHELHELENRYPQRFRAFYVLDRAPAEWVGGRGHINKDLLKTVLPEPGSGNIKLFVCGPPGMYKAISGAKKSPTDQGELAGALKELGYSAEQVYKF